MKIENTADNQIVRRLYIVLFVRLLLGLAFFTITFYFFWRNKTSVTNSEITPFYIFSLLLLLFTLIGAIALKYFHDKALSINAICQITFDIIAVSVFVCLSGGSSSPFVTFYVPVVLLASLLFGTRGALRVAIVTIIMYSFILFLQYHRLLCCKGIITRSLNFNLQKSNLIYNLVVHSITLVISALVAGFFVDKLQVAEKLLIGYIKKFKFLRYLHEQILESVPSGVILTDINGKIIYANDAAINILGLSRVATNKYNIFDLFPVIKRELSLYSNRNYDSKSLILRSEIRYKNKVIGCGFCMFRKNNGFNGYIVVFQDITHIIEAEKRQRMLEDFKLVARASAEIAHNIKNPLGAISGAAQMLDRFTSDTEQPEIKQLLKIIVKETERLNDAVRTLLQMSKSTFRSPIPEKINLFSKIKGFVKLFPSKPNIEIISEAEDYSVFMDPLDLEIILWNLLDNAREAVGEDGTITIAITEAKEKGYVELKVCDDGPGIPEDYREHIFDPFFTSKPNGTGLGLNIVLQLVSRAGGKISYETSSKGTCFEVLLPKA